LCTNVVDPDGVSALVACRLIALNKCPGVRPIGVFIFYLFYFIALWCKHAPKVCW